MYLVDFRSFDLTILSVNFRENIEEPDIQKWSIQTMKAPSKKVDIAKDDGHGWYKNIDLTESSKKADLNRHTAYKKVPYTKYGRSYARYKQNRFSKTRGKMRAYLVFLL